MNVWLIGDIHFGVHVNSLQWLDISRRFIYSFLIPTLKKHMGPDDVIVQLGDVFENRQHLNINIMNQAVKMMKDLSDVLPIYIIAGNHDAYYLDNNSVTSIEMLESANIYTYTTPFELEFIDKKWLMLPWERDTDKIAETLEKHKDCDIVVGHFDTAGFTYDNSRPIYGGLNSELLENFERIYLGHIHWRQEKKNILYTGTPYQMTRGDIGNDKGVYRVCQVDGKLEEEFIPNHLSPTFAREDIYDFLERPANSLKHKFDGTFLDMQLDSKFARKFDFMRIIDVFEKHDVETEKIEFITAGQTDLTDDIGIIDINSNFSLNDIAVLALQHMKYNKKEIDDAMPYFNDLQIRAKDGKK